MPDMIQRVLDYLGIGGYSPGVVLIELLLIGAVVYTGLRFLHGTRGARLFQGVLFLIVASFLVVRLLADTFDWARIRILYQYFMWGVFLTALVVFQPELRRGLMRLGETGWFRRYLGGKSAIDPIVMAVAELSRKKIGALIALEREVQLGALADTGVRMDATISAELLETIFWPGTALHDMGVIIRGDMITAAGCQFPLAESGDVDRSLGSRHRAAVGLSAESDAVVVVVSEETGFISVCMGGNMQRGLTLDELQHTLTDALRLNTSQRGFFQAAS